MNAEERLNSLSQDALRLYGNEYYRAQVSAFRDIVAKSRDRNLYRKPLVHLQMQQELLILLGAIEQANSDAKRIIRTDPDNQELIDQRSRNKTLALVARQIADGIAWRTSGNSKFTLRVISQAESPGSVINKAGRDAEITYARNAASNGSFVILHDLTNIYRIGDLSIVRKIGDTDPYLGEVKSHGRNIRIATASKISQDIDGGKSVTKQEIRLLQAQVMLTARKWTDNNGVIDVIPLKVTGKNLMPSVGALLKRATKLGVAGRYITPYMFVDALDLSTLSGSSMAVDVFSTRLSKLGRPVPSRLLSYYSSYENLTALLVTQVERNSPPYSVYPFSSDTIVKIISGQMIINTFIVRDQLDATLKIYGYRLSSDQAELDRLLNLYGGMTDEDFLSSKRLFPEFPVKDYIHIKHIESGFMFPFMMPLIYMLREFMSIESIIQISENLRKRTTPGIAQTFYQDIIDNRFS